MPRLSRCKRKGVKALGECIDMSDAAAYTAWVERAAGPARRLRHLHLLRLRRRRPRQRRDLEEAVFELDLLATFRGIQAALPYLEKSKAGSIVAYPHRGRWRTSSARRPTTP